MPYTVRSRRRNPPANVPWNKSSEPKAIKQITGALKFASMPHTKADAEKVFRKLKAADPTKRSAKQYQFLKWLVDVFKADPQETLDDLPMAKEYLEIIVEAQKAPTNPEWAARPLNMKFARSVQALGQHLASYGQVKFEAPTQWLKEAYKLQNSGDAYVAVGLDQTGGEAAIVEILTQKAAEKLGETTGWCTAKGAFGSYADRGIAILYFPNEVSPTTGTTPHIVQFVTDFSESRAEDNVTEISWNRVPYKAHKDRAEKTATKMKKRMKLMKKMPITSAIKSIAKNGGKLTQDQKWLIKEYPNLNFPPLRYIQQNWRMLVSFLDAREYSAELGKEYRALRKATVADKLNLELCALQHPVGWWLISREKQGNDAGKKVLPPLTSMAPIPAGKHKFQDMEVHLRAFELGAYEVTVGLWLFVMKDTKRDLGKFESIRMPITEVSWYDCVHFCNKFSELCGIEPAYEIKGDPSAPDEVNWIWDSDGFRLPSEAEWEAAARAKGKFIYAGSDNPDEVAWYADNSGGRAHAVGGKKPNKYGLYDMSGNVWEWCYDSYSRDPKDKKEHPDFYGDMAKRANRRRRR